MNSEIVKTLKVMCNQEDPQDQKLLLLAELVETKCEALVQHQDTLQKSLDKTNEKLDKVTDLLEKIESEGLRENLIHDEIPQTVIPNDIRHYRTDWRIVQFKHSRST